VSKAFTDLGLKWIPAIISAAAVAGITSVLFSFMLAAARVWFSMSRDGLLPKWFSGIHPKFHTPHRPTLLIGVVTALVAGFTPIEKVTELVNIGTLSAFILICASIMILRVKRPDLERSFRTPWVPIVPIVGILFSGWLMTKLPAITWMRFLAWLIVGIVVYSVYGLRKSNLAQQPTQETK
jgi:APA family basic amino acid/polyamine antiporter